MKRPENVRCENCCYAHETENKNLLCMKRPPATINLACKAEDADVWARMERYPRVEPFYFCGEFMEQWPGRKPCDEMYCESCLEPWEWMRYPSCSCDPDVRPGSSAKSSTVGGYMAGEDIGEGERIQLRFDEGVNEWRWVRARDG